MNAMTMKAPAAARPLTRRALAKRETREKIVLAARTLFVERGYERATIRDIAAEAGMSTGAVFASFADKAELFTEIVTQDDRDHARAMAEVEHEGPLADVLTAVFRAGYGFHLAHLPLLQAAVSAAWVSEQNAQARDRSARRPVLDVLEARLRDGQARGDLPAKVDIDLLARMLWDSYAANYRSLLHDGLDLEGLTTLSSRQIAVILAGAAQAL